MLTGSAIYGHLTRWLPVGARVSQSQVIGTIRKFSNGGESMPHLHFGIYTGGCKPTRHLGYNDNLHGYHDPSKWLEMNAMGGNKSVVASLAEWSPTFSFVGE